jgi:hypothetical protein
MLRIFFEFAFLIIFIAWTLAEALSALGRWSDKRADSRLARDMEMGRPAKDPRERGSDFGTLPVFAMVLLFLLLVPNAVTSNGQSISLHEVSASVRVSDVSPVATFVNAWRAEFPLGFWGFFFGLPATVIWLFRRSPALLGVAVVVALFLFWLKMKGGSWTLGF